MLTMDVDSSVGDESSHIGLNSRCYSDTSAENQAEAWDLRFEDTSSEQNFFSLLSILEYLILFYLICTSFTSCSSPYTTSSSNLDHIMLTSDIFCVDLVSAFFVLFGFVCAFVYYRVGVQVFAYMRTDVLISIFVDLWCSGIAAVTIGSIDALIKKRFKFTDIGLTLIEHGVALRCLDVHQSLLSPHSLNVSSWPVQCIVWCLFSVHPTLTTNHFLFTQFNIFGRYAVMVMAVCGIVLFTLFGMLHSHSNIFYANSTAFTYRTLEFNLGIHLFYLSEVEDGITLNLINLLQKSGRGILFVFLCIWWSEIGSLSPSYKKDEICLRLYPLNNCLRDHHAFLLRGCFLGIGLISIFVTQEKNDTRTPKTKVCDKIQRIHILASAATFAWPVYQTIQLIFIITFGEESINKNMPLMSVLQPCFLLLSATLYVYFAKPKMSMELKKFVSSFSRTGDANWDSNRSELTDEEEDLQDMDP
jgi:hypothetical protein